MRNKIIIMAIITILLGCGQNTSDMQADDIDNIICMQGVQYYKIKEVKKYSYHGYGFMAPVYDKNTKQVKLCDQVEGLK